MQSHLASFIGADLMGDHANTVCRLPVVGAVTPQPALASMPTVVAFTEPHIGRPRYEREGWSLRRIQDGTGLQPAAGGWIANWRMWRYDAICDPADGAVLRVVLARDAAPEQVAIRYPADAANQLWANNYEGWHAPLTQPPPITLAQALAVVEKEFGAIRCGMIVAHPLKWSEGGGEPRPAWSIDLRQMVSSATADMPARDGSHLRHIVFADTGQWVTAINTPHDMVVEVRPVADQAEKEKP